MSTKFKLHILMIFSLSFFTRCVSKKAGLVYDDKTQLKLDVYSPKNKKEKKEVLVFIHGGNWRTGKRSTYKFFGKGFARKGIVTVAIDYRLTDVTDFKGMTQDAAKAVRWVQDNIAAYGGDVNKIFLSGHSSGGHLAALLATDESYFKELGITNPIKGAALIDAFGLDMYTYLKNSQNKEDSIYYPTFSKDPQYWKKGSPMYFLDKTSPRFILFVGGSTYPTIKFYSTEFLRTAKIYRPETKLIELRRKKHVAMIGQFYNPRNRCYMDILEFMGKKR